MKHLGIDVHQKYSEICGVGGKGEVTVRRRIPTTECSLRRFFKSRPRRRVRSALVKSRTALMNTIRGTLRAQGYQMASRAFPAT